MRASQRSLLAAGAVMLLVAAGCSNDAGDSDSSADEADAGAGEEVTPAAGEDEPTASDDSATTDLTIAVVSHGAAGDSFWDVVKSGAEQAGSDLGITVTYSGDGDPSAQSQLIDNAVAQGVDGLVVSMANPDGVRGSVEGAVDAGIPVVTINSGLERSEEFGAVTHVGQSEELAGEAAGERLAEAGATNVVCVIHEAGNVGLESRCAGAATGLGDNGEVENLQVDISNTADAQSTIHSKLLSDSSVDAVLTLNPVIAVSAVQARAEAESDAILATFDLSEDITAAIEAGDILFAVDQQPYLQGYLPVSFLYLRATNGNDVGGGQPVYSGPGFVTEENAAEVAEYAARGTR